MLLFHLWLESAARLLCQKTATNATAAAKAPPWTVFSYPTTIRSQAVLIVIPISAYEILNNRVLVVDKAALQKIEEVFA